MGGVLSSAFPSKIEAPTRRVFKFMIERVLGKYIKLADDKFSAEDLGVSLANGQGYLRNLSLNEANINETFEKYLVPLRLVKSHIGSVEVVMPRAALNTDAALSTDAITIKLSHVHVTARPRPIQPPPPQAGDLKESVIEVVADNLVRSLDNLNILDEIMQQDSSHGSEEPSGKVEMDNILQAAFDKLQVVIEDLVVRLEFDLPNAEKHMQGLELHIGRVSMRGVGSRPSKESFHGSHKGKEFDVSDIKIFWLNGESEVDQLAAASPSPASQPSSSTSRTQSPSAVPGNLSYPTWSTGELDSFESLPIGVPTASSFDSMHSVDSVHSARGTDESPDSLHSLHSLHSADSASFQSTHNGAADLPTTAQWSLNSAQSADSATAGPWSLNSAQSAELQSCDEDEAAVAASSLTGSNSSHALTDSVDLYESCESELAESVPTSHPVPAAAAAASAASRPAPVQYCKGRTQIAELYGGMHFKICKKKEEKRSVDSGPMLLVEGECGKVRVFLSPSTLADVVKTLTLQSERLSTGAGDCVGMSSHVGVMPKIKVRERFSKWGLKQDSPAKPKTPNLHDSVRDPFSTPGSPWNQSPHSSPAAGGGSKQGAGVRDTVLEDSDEDCDEFVSATSDMWPSVQPVSAYGELAAKQSRTAASGYGAYPPPSAATRAPATTQQQAVAGAGGVVTQQPVPSQQPWQQPGRTAAAQDLPLRSQPQPSRSSKTQQEGMATKEEDMFLVQCVANNVVVLLLEEDPSQTSMTKLSQDYFWRMRDMPAEDLDGILRQSAGAFPHVVCSGCCNYDHIGLIMEKTSCDFTRSQSKAGSVTGAVLKNRALVLYECLYGRSDSAHAAHSSAAAAAAAASAAPGQPEITRLLGSAPPVSQGVDNEEYSTYINVEMRKIPSKPSSASIDCDFKRVYVGADITLAYRLRHLLKAMPSDNAGTSARRSASDAPQQDTREAEKLYAEMYNKAMEGSSQSLYSLTVNCNHLKLAVRFPKADLRPADERDADARQPESLLIYADECHFSTEHTALSSEKVSTFNLKFEKISGYMMDGVDASARTLFMECLPAAGTMALEQLHGIGMPATPEMTITQVTFDPAWCGDSPEAPVSPCVGDDEMLDGIQFEKSTAAPSPFTHSASYEVLPDKMADMGRGVQDDAKHEKQVYPGNDSELKKFEDSARQNSKLVVSLSLPLVYVHLKNKPFLELLYNRVVNDLLMWAPPPEDNLIESLDDIVQPTAFIPNFQLPFEGFIPSRGMADSFFVVPADVGMESGMPSLNLNMGSLQMPQVHPHRLDQQRSNSQRQRPHGQPNVTRQQASTDTGKHNDLALILNIGQACLTAFTGEGANKEEEKDASAASSDAGMESDASSLPSATNFPSFSNQRHGQFKLDLNQLQICAVTGVDGNADAIQCSIQSKEADLAHCASVPANQDLFIALSRSLLDVTSCKYLKNVVKASGIGDADGATSAGGQRRGKQQDQEKFNTNGLSVAIGLDKDVERGLKTYQASILFHNVLYTHRMAPDTEPFWLGQARDFISMTDQVIPGYEWPKAQTNFCLHFRQAAILYRPLHLSLAVALTCKMFSLACSVVDQSKTTLLSIFGTDLRLHLSNNAEDRNIKRDFICLACLRNILLRWSMDDSELPVVHNHRLMDFTVLRHVDSALHEATTTAAGQDAEKRNVTLSRITFTSSLLMISVCADSCKAMVELITYVAGDGDMQNSAEESAMVAGTPAGSAGSSRRGSLSSCSGSGSSGSCGFARSGANADSDGTAPRPHPRPHSCALQTSSQEQERCAVPSPQQYFTASPSTTSATGSGSIAMSSPSPTWSASPSLLTSAIDEPATATFAAAAAATGFDSDEEDNRAFEAKIRREIEANLAADEFLSDSENEQRVKEAVAKHKAAKRSKKKSKRRPVATVKPQRSSVADALSDAMGDLWGGNSSTTSAVTSSVSQVLSSDESSEDDWEVVDTAKYPSRPIGCAIRDTRASGGGLEELPPSAPLPDCFNFPGKPDFFVSKPGPSDALDPTFQARYGTPVSRIELASLNLNIQIVGGEDFPDKRETTERERTTRTRPVAVATVRPSARPHHRLRADFPVNDIWKSQQLKFGGSGRKKDMVEVELKMLRFKFEEFPDWAKFSSRLAVVVADIEVRDRVTTSKMNKFMYRYVTDPYMLKALPETVIFKKVTAAVVPTDGGGSGEVTEEDEVSVVIQPLRFNIDQDCMMFIKDFFDYLSASADQGTGNDAAVRSRSGSTASASGTPPRARRSHESSPQSSASGEAAAMAHRAALIRDAANATAAAAAAPATAKRQEGTASLSRTTSSTGLPRQPSSRRIKKFTLAPTYVMVDYDGNRSGKTGSATSFVLSLAELNKAKIVIPAQKHESVTDYNELVQSVLKWIHADIVRNQVPGIVAHISLLHQFRQLFQGVYDLLLMPIQQYKRDGRILMGLQRGASSFTLLTFVSTMELSSRFMQSVQVLAETMYDVVTPSAVQELERQPGEFRAHRNAAQPADLREAVVSAATELRTGFVDSAQNFISAAQTEYRAKGTSGAVGGAVRQIASSTLRPVVSSAKAANTMLQGARNHVLPDEFRESEDKYRRTAD